MKTSKNALAQAVKIVRPDITKTELFKLLEVPACFTTVTRYWLGTYGNKPWEKRSDDERSLALQAAKELISSTGAPSKQRHGISPLLSARPPALTRSGCRAIPVSRSIM